MEHRASKDWVRFSSVSTVVKDVRLPVDKTP